jgi:hypothetical protein
MRYRANRTRFKWNHKSKQYSLVKISKLYYVINVRIRTVSQTAALQLVRSNKSHPPRGRFGLPNHIKESIKIKPRGTRLSYHVTWCDVLRGDPASWARYNQRPIWTGPIARIRSDRLQVWIRWSFSAVCKSCDNLKPRFAFQQWSIG